MNHGFPRFIAVTFICRKVWVLIHDEHLKFWVGGRHQVGFSEMDSRISLTFMKSACLTNGDSPQSHLSAADLPRMKRPKNRILSGSVLVETSLTIQFRDRTLTI
jgi:hypothetical protein